MLTVTAGPPHNPFRRRIILCMGLLHSHMLHCRLCAFTIPSSALQQRCGQHNVIMRVQTWCHLAAAVSSNYRNDIINSDGEQLRRQNDAVMQLAEVSLKLFKWLTMHFTGNSQADCVQQPLCLPRHALEGATMRFHCHAHSWLDLFSSPIVRAWPVSWCTGQWIV